MLCFALHFILFYFILFIALHCIAMHCILSHCIVFYRIALHCIALYCIVLYCIVLYCIVLYCIVLYCIVLYCIVSYRIVSYRIVSYRIVECSHKNVTYAHGESFVDDCNMCVCNHGLVACTNNTCNEGLIIAHLSRDARKPVFGVSDQVRHKLTCIVTEAGQKFEISGLRRREIVLSV